MSALLLPLARQLVYSKRALVLFVVVGPLVALFSTSDAAGAIKAGILPVLYLIGSVLAAMCWVLFSFTFAALARLQEQSGPQSLVSTEWFTILLGPVVGAAAGYLITGMTTCSSVQRIARLSECAMVLIERDYGITLLPGMICGLLATLIWARR
ncbi:hypothetical protein [Eleftheria terrae]|uniref:hypothetical protein n=1 Tax=Eleftheria terrae TaxID=1597781 RepID=UPI00263AC42A|nr:hypothetical protein [Eleftheria terrae]WKB50832.1 hypothetical protein N7L95_13505 [Eleftheria terrae]